jgi:hypothetical protein
MRKLAAVEEAKELFNEAKDWGVWRWLLEKRRVRAAADVANATLDQAEASVKAGWSDDLKRAYRELEVEAPVNGNRRARRQPEKAKEEAKDVSPEVKLLAAQVKEAADRAYKAHLDAEEMFDEAERYLSAAMAREAAEKAIESWILHEKAIRKGEAAARTHHLSM